MKVKKPKQTAKQIREELEVDNTTIELDLQALFKAPIDSEDAWVNVTPILQSDFSRIKKIANWLRLDGVKEYIQIVHEEIFKGNGGLPLKLPFKESQYLNKDWLDEPTPLIITRRGQHHSGTWLHKEVFIEFITTLNPKLRRQLHKAVMDVIVKANVMKIDRADTKFLFHPLTDAIRDIYLPRQSEYDKQWVYPNIMDLVNLNAIGMTSRVYKETHGLTKEQIKLDGNISIRDYMTQSELNRIKKVEQDVHGFIIYANITNYGELAQKLEGMKR